MSDLCTNAVSPNSCSHFVIDGLDDGQAWPSPLQVHDSDLLVPLTDEEKIQLRRLLLRRLRQSGVTLQQFIGRVVRGEEATNVKPFTLIGPGGAITITNMRSAGANTYTNVCPGLNGERQPVEFTGCTQFYLHGHANFAGVGPFNVRVVRDSDSAVIFESGSVAAGEREVDTGWTDLPVLNPVLTGVIKVRVQIKSATATDDPVFRGLVMDTR